MIFNKNKFKILIMTEVTFNGSIDLKTKDVRNHNVSNNTPKRNFNKRGNNVKPQVRVKSVDEIKEQLVKALESVGGKYVKFDDVDHMEGLLIGAVNRNFDSMSAQDNMCFVILDRDRHVQYVNYNTHFSVYRNGVPSSLYVLDYLYTKDPYALLNTTTNTLEYDKVTMLTKIYIHVPQKNKKSNNKNNRNTK